MYSTLMKSKQVAVAYQNFAQNNPPTNPLGSIGGRSNSLSGIGGDAAKRLKTINSQSSAFSPPSAFTATNATHHSSGHHGSSHHSGHHSNHHSNHHGGHGHSSQQSGHQSQNNQPIANKELLSIPSASILQNVPRLPVVFFIQ